jgi:hypothetical protein
MNDKAEGSNIEDNQPEKIVKALYEGEIQLAEGADPLTVAVLEDGTRLISRNAMFRAFNRTKRGRAIGETRAENLPSFADAKNLQPYISADLYEILTNPIKCKTKAGPIIDGYRAEILPLLCDAYLDASNDGKLTASQKPLAVAAIVIVRALSKLGVIALIDEATGYQYERERDELQKILKMYVAEELRPWTKTFQDVFYKEIFRLNGWDFTASSIKKRPGVIGRWTNDLVYDQLPKGVLKELKNKTPKSSAGNYTARLFQSLTSDIGDPSLQAQINSVITLMQISDKWEDFMARFKRLVQRRSGQLEVNFDGHSGDQLKPVSRDNFDQSLNGLLNVPPPKPAKKKPDADKSKPTE